MSEIGRVIGLLSTAMIKGFLGPGELAQLRRIDPLRPYCPAFWHSLTAWIAPDRTLPPGQETRWAIILSGMARMVGLLHIPGYPLGRALAESGFNEGRLNRLLRVTDVAGLAVQVRRVSRFLAAGGVSVNWVDFAYFILTTDPEKREESNRRIARDYYYTTNQKEKAR